MKTSAILALVMFAAILLGSRITRAQPARENALVVEVEGLHSDTGTADRALFASADGFPNDAGKALKTASGAIKNGRAECKFSGVTSGQYAVAVFHDENSNGKLDRNFIGVPKEGVGASNNPPPRFGPPKFDDARFNYPGGTQTITVHIRYLR